MESRQEEVVRVRYLQPFEVDVDLETGRVLAVATTGEPEPDLSPERPGVCVDARGDFLYPATQSAVSEAYEQAQDQLVAYRDGALIAVEIVPREQ